jgi:hypothetical protein
MYYAFSKLEMLLQLPLQSGNAYFNIVADHSSITSDELHLHFFLLGKLDFFRQYFKKFKRETQKRYLVRVKTLKLAGVSQYPAWVLYVHATSMNTHTPATKGEWKKRVANHHDHSKKIHQQDGFNLIPLTKKKTGQHLMISEIALNHLQSRSEFAVTSINNHFTKNTIAS